MNRLEAVLHRNDFLLTSSGMALMVASYFVDTGLSKFLGSLSMLLIVLASTELIRRKWAGRIMLAVLALSLASKALLLPFHIMAGNLLPILPLLIIVAATARTIQVMRRGRQLRIVQQA